MDFYRLVVREGRMCDDTNLNGHAETLDRMLAELAKYAVNSALEARIESEARQIMNWRSSTAGPMPQSLVEADQSKRARRG